MIHGRYNHGMPRGCYHTETARTRYLVESQDTWKTSLNDSKVPGPMTAPPSQDHEVQSNGLEASCQYNDDLCSELHPFSSFPDFPSLRTTAYDLGTTLPPADMLGTYELVSDHIVH